MPLPDCSALWHRTTLSPPVPPPKRKADWLLLGKVDQETLFPTLFSLEHPPPPPPPHTHCFLVSIRVGYKQEGKSIAVAEPKIQLYFSPKWKKCQTEKSKCHGGSFLWGHGDSGSYLYSLPCLQGYFMIQDWYWCCRWQGQGSSWKKEDSREEQTGGTPQLSWLSLSMNQSTPFLYIPLGPER